MVARRRAEQAAQQRQLAEIRAQQAIDRARAIEAAEAAKAQNQSTPQTADQALPSSTSAVTLNEAMPNDSQQQSVEASRTADPSPPAPAPSPPSPPPQDEERSKPLLQAEEHSEQEEEEEDGNEVRVPETFLSVQAKTINEATSDAERIEAIITGFQILATSPDFRPVITKMFGLCKLNRKQEALDHLVEILEFFSDNEVLSPDLPKMARADFDKHWDLIRAHLKFPDVPEVKPNGSADVEAQA
jgi:type IV secretory pathway VirB10-like protein